MQTVVWMAYSDSSHFFDKISYKILFISTYRLKDMILTKFKHLQQFFRNNTEFAESFLTEMQTSPGHRPAGPWG
jgi:predicted aminopeptidase